MPTAVQGLFPIKNSRVFRIIELHGLAILHDRIMAADGEVHVIPFFLDKTEIHLNFIAHLIVSQIGHSGALAGKDDLPFPDVTVAVLIDRDNRAHQRIGLRTNLAAFHLDNQLQAAFRLGRITVGLCKQDRSSKAFTGTIDPLNADPILNGEPAR